MKNKVITLVVALVLLMVVPVPGFVSDTESITSNSPKPIDLKYTVGESYTVKIPKSVSFDATGAAAGTVEAEKVVIALGKKMTVTLASGNFEDSKHHVVLGASKIAYSIAYVEGTGGTPTPINTDSAPILTINAGDPLKNTELTFTATLGGATLAGEHKDTLTFTVAIDDQ